MSTPATPSLLGKDALTAVLQVPGWEQHTWLWHGFSTRAGGVSRVYLDDFARDDHAATGDLNLGFTDLDDPEAVRENRRRFVAAVTGAEPAPPGEIPLISRIPLDLVRQVHSNRSVTIEATDGCLVEPATVEADGLMSDQPGRLIGILTADCIPVLVADPEHRAVAAFHAGWRGTVEQIVELGVGRMQELYGSEPASLVAAIGPGIGPYCYTVGEEVLSRFSERFSYAAELFSRDTAGQTSPAALRLDLTEANRRQLVAAGLEPESIALVGGCTSCQPRQFFSHRASGGRAGRMMAAIGVRN